MRGLVMLLAGCPGLAPPQDDEGTTPIPNVDAAAPDTDSDTDTDPDTDTDTDP